MMKKKDLICIATPKFEGEYMKSTVKLMENLTHKYRITYVDYPMTYKDLLILLFDRKWSKVLKLLGINSRVKTISQPNGDFINVVTLPPMIPCNFIKNHFLYDLIQKINSKIALQSIQKVNKKLVVKKPIVVNAFQPFLGVNLIGKLNESSNIYYCYDEISHANWLGKHGKRYEEEFIKKVDQVIVSSNTLKSNKSTLNKNTAVVHNGVDYKLFSSVPKLDLFEKKNPTIGYLGTIDERIDLKLMHSLITSNADKTFLFVGRCISDMVKNELTQYTNVIFKGPQPIPTLPYWIEIMDVCIIPFVSNEFTRSIYPLKINEYLTQGKPVVTTRFTDLKCFEPYIYSANSINSFQDRISVAMAEQNATIKDKRMSLAAHNSWKARAKEAIKIIEKVA